MSIQTSYRCLQNLILVITRTRTESCFERFQKSLPVLVQVPVIPVHVISCVPALRETPANSSTPPPQRPYYGAKLPSSASDGSLFTLTSVLCVSF